MTFRAILALCLTALSLTGTADVLRTVGELKAALQSSDLGREFDVAGEVYSFHPDFLGAWLYSINDGTDACFVSEPGAPGKTRPAPRQFGHLDRVRFSGRVQSVENRPRAVFHHAELLAKGDLDGIRELKSADLLSTDRYGEIVRMRGRIRDAVREDTDATYVHMTLADNEGTVNLMVIEPPQFPSDFRPFIGAEVNIVGRCDDSRSGLHHNLGRYLNVSGLDSITIVSPPAAIGNAPGVDVLAGVPPRQIAAAGFHRTDGTVIAVWSGASVLLRTPAARLVRVQFREDCKRSPRFGDAIRVLGLPVTDSFSVNLVKAVWEPGGGAPPPPDAPVDVKAEDLTRNEHGFHQLMMEYYGRAIRLTGLVRYLPDATHGHLPMQLESGGEAFAVDLSSLAELPAALELGSRISVTGTCIIDRDNFYPESGVPGKGRLLIVPRLEDDLVILARSPRWMTRVLAGATGAMLLALVAFFIRNRVLKRISDLRLKERTQLAVELHDALSQTLTGVSMQIDTAAGIARENQPAVTKCLDLASRTVDSCRMELRNTLWDLRTAALDEPNLDTAIRRSIRRNLEDVDLRIRFAVPRSALSDNIAHAILKIIRELVTNAIAHGGATVVRVAGSRERDRLLFSVSDNGSGFDPDLAPGISEGHFGLQGISERLEQLDGRMSIRSAPGKGAKIRISLPIPRSGEFRPRPQT